MSIKIYYHIGLPKTATTFIQYNLKLNSNMGLYDYYPKIMKINGSRLKTRTVIMSDEKYIPLFGETPYGSNKIKNKIRDLYLLNKMYKCHIIIYLRRQDKLINSIYKQISKENNKIVPRFNTFIKEKCFYFSYVELLNSFKQYFKGNIIIDYYDYLENKIINSKDFFINFWQKIFLNKLPRLVDENYRNISLNSNDSIKINELKKKGLNTQYIRKIFEIKQTNFEDNDSFINDELKDIIIEFYIDSNRKIINNQNLFLNKYYLEKN